MDKQNTKVKMAARLLVQYLLEHRESLKMAAKQMPPPVREPRLPQAVPSTPGSVGSDQAGSQPDRTGMQGG